MSPATIHLNCAEIVDGQFELFDQQLAALGGLPEMLAPGFGQKQLQPLDFEASDRQFALRQDAQRLLFFQQCACRNDHRVGAGQGPGQVVGEVIWELCHKQQQSIFGTIHQA